MQSRRKTWLFGGIALIVCGVLSVLRDSISLFPAAGLLVSISVVADVVWAISVMIFAIGFGREGSVVDRKPLGVTAMCLVAVWPLVSAIVSTVLSTVLPVPDERWLMWGYAGALIPFAAGLIASVEIARAGVVPLPWKWAPMVALGLSTLAWLLPQLLTVGAGASDAANLVPLFSGLGTLSVLVSTFGLGIVATVLATRNRSGVVEIYTSQPTESTPSL